MAILNLLSNLTVKKPTGPWETLLGLFNFIENYGLRIIVFTIILKLILSPLDFYQKYKMKKNQLINERLKPELEKLQKKFGDDKVALQQEQMRIQRAAGFSYFSSCIPLILTLVIFISFFAGMRNISQYEEFKQYVGVYDIYSTHYTQLTGLNISGQEGWNQNEYDDELFNEAIINWHNSSELNDNQKRAYNQFATEYNSSFKAMYSDLVNLRQYVRLFNVAELKPSGQYEYTSVDASLFVNGNPNGRFDVKAVYQSALPSAENAKNEIIAALNAQLAKDGSTFRTQYVIFDEVYADFLLLDKEIALKDNVTLLIEVAEKESAQKAYEYYKDAKNSKFLWIKSLWVPDVFWKDAIPEFDTFRNNVNKYFKIESSGKNKGGLSPEVLDSLNSERTYNKVMQKIRQDKSIAGKNGYLILAFLAVSLSLLSQYITMRQQKKSGQITPQSDSSMKMMMFIMPIMIGFFAFFYTAAFALYMITNSAMTLIINLITSAVIGGIFRTKQKENISESGAIKYGRKDPNDYINKRR